MYRNARIRKCGNGFGKTTKVIGVGMRKHDPLWYDLVFLQKRNDEVGRVAAHNCVYENWMIAVHQIRERIERSMPPAKAVYVRDNLKRRIDSHRHSATA